MKLCIQSLVCIKIYVKKLKKKHGEKKLNPLHRSHGDTYNYIPCIFAPSMNKSSCAFEIFKIFYRTL